MSNQGASDRLPVTDGCCSPLAEEPLVVARAVELARAFKALGDPVRLRLLSLIASHRGGEVCVCDLSEGFDLAGPTISHHLKVLREAGLISGQRRGTWVYYRADPEALRRLSGVLATSDAAGGEQVRGTDRGATALRPTGPGARHPVRRPPAHPPRPPASRGAR